MNDTPKDKKIIIDEDWKSQVEEEREQLKKEPASDTDQPDGPAEEAFQLPPPSFGFLVSSMATQAMAALGQLPDPVEKKPIVHLGLAKHHIDTLAILEEKTKGNLTSEETRMMDDVLHQLRMLFVAVQNHGAAPPEPNSQ